MQCPRKPKRMTPLPNSNNWRRWKSKWKITSPKKKSSYLPIIWNDFRLNWVNLLAPPVMLINYKKLIPIRSFNWNSVSSFLVSLEMWTKTIHVKLIFIETFPTKRLLTSWKMYNGKEIIRFITVHRTKWPIMKHFGCRVLNYFPRSVVCMP